MGVMEHADVDRSTGEVPDSELPKLLSALTSSELAMGDYTLEYLIDRTLVAGQPCIVAGGHKTLKTSVMVDMAISLSSAGFFLGKSPEGF